MTSAAFDNGEELDPSFTADEDDPVAPPLEWTAPPEGAMELALIVEDPDVNGEGARLSLAGLGPRAAEGQIARR